MIEVITGLADNDRVITVGHVGLKDDAVVTVINATEDAQVSDNAPTD